MTVCFIKIHFFVYIDFLFFVLWTRLNQYYFIKDDYQIIANMKKFI